MTASPASFDSQKRLGAPVALLAELTHRCPLGCPYCSNPLALDPREDELSTSDWNRVFSQAATLGVLHAHLSGGEPAARHDLHRHRRALRECGALYQSHHLRDRPHAGSRQGTRASRARPCAAFDSGFQMRRRPTGSPATRAPSPASRRSRNGSRKPACRSPSTPSSTAPIFVRAGRYGASSPSSSARGGSKSRIRNITAGGSPIAPRSCLADRGGSGYRRGRSTQKDACRGHRHRPCHPRLPRPLPEGLHGRMGQARAQCHAIRQSAALPRGGNHS